MKRVRPLSLIHQTQFGRGHPHPDIVGADTQIAADGQFAARTEGIAI